MENVVRDNQTAGIQQKEGEPVMWGWQEHTSLSSACCYGHVHQDLHSSAW